MLTLSSRAIAIGTAAAIALTTLGLQPAAAHPRDRDAAVALGAFAAIFGTIATIVAAEQYRDQAPEVPAYGYGPAYGPVYRPYGDWHHHHEWHHSNER
jgi:hypothetical protein